MDVIVSERWLVLHTHTKQTCTNKIGNANTVERDDEIALVSNEWKTALPCFIHKTQVNDERKKYFVTFR